MRDVADHDICWGPECGNAVEQKRMGRAKLYCSPACRIKALRRNGGKAPETPYPPLRVIPLRPAAEVLPSKPPEVLEPVTPPAPAPARKAPKPRGKRKPAAPPMQRPDGEGVRTPPAEPAFAPVTHLHVAVTEDSTVPVTVKVHPMVARYQADLEEMGMADTRQGLQVLAMAEKLVSSATSPAAAANLSKELERLMAQLEQNTPSALAAQDPSTVIRDRTVAKLRAVAGGAG